MFLVAYSNPFLPGARFDHLANAGARFGLRFSNCGQRTVNRVVVSPRNQKLLGREARDDLVASFGDDDFFLNARGTPAIRRGPVPLI